MNRLAMRHVRLLGSMLAGIAVFWLLPEDWALVSRLLTGWDVFTLSFLALAFIWMAGLSPKEIGERYQEEDEAAPVILLVVIAAALTSLLAIVALLVSAKHAGDEERNFRIGLAALTVASSWVLAATMFTLHYAEMFYRAKTDARPLAFPKTPLPVFVDFAYFSFTIAAACQTADVATSHGSIRRIVLAQTVISFVFNLAILGFAVNVTAGILGNG